MEQPDLFPEPALRRRRPNHQPPEKDVLIRYELTASERACLKHREPGPSGQIGGYQRLENWLVHALDHHPETTATKFVVDLDTERRRRLTHPSHAIFGIPAFTLGLGRRWRRRSHGDDVMFSHAD